MYKDSKQAIEIRVEDLLGRMTLEEMVAQLTCAMTMTLNQADLSKSLPHGIGTLSCLNSSLTGNNKKDMKLLYDIQKYLVEESRLGIPAIIHNEGIAGAQIPGATTFPQSLGMAATWEPELANAAGEVVRKQLKAFGFTAVHSPLFDLCRDPRWGRSGETYGEDPYLVAQMGVGFVKGLQGEHEIMATAKHFIGYGNAEGGRNGGEMQIGIQKLLDTYCYPFEAAIWEADVSAVMNAYGLVNDQPVASSSWLLTDILRKKLGFKGLVVADYGSIGRMNGRHRTAADARQSGVQALKAGMDVEQPNNSCYKYLIDAVNEGELDKSYIERSVRRILTMKFKLGLFEHPYSKGDFASEISRKTYVDLSRNIAEKSIVMVKNEENILPLKHPKKIALIGPLADSVLEFFGGYSSVGTATTTSSDFDRSEADSYLRTVYTSMITEYKDSLKERMGIEFEDEPTKEQKIQIMDMLRKRGTKTVDKTYQNAGEFLTAYYPNCRTIRQVLQSVYGSENVRYEKGCEINQVIDGGFEQACQAVKDADLVIAVLGGKESMRATDATCGENKDNANIGLEQSQMDLMEEVYRCGKPIVSILIDGRPLACERLSEQSNALLYAWLPAQAGAEAIVNVITGVCNPGGKLPVTILKNAGQIPMYHGRLLIYAEADQWAEYVRQEDNMPLYPYGFGLSYTEFSYSDLKIDSEVLTEESLNVRFKVKNIGSTEGDEVVQLYVADLLSNIARPTKQLVAFSRINLKVGEEKEVHVTIDMRQLAYHDVDMKQVVEPGEMKLYIGASSQDIRLTSKFIIKGERSEIDRKVFTALVTSETI